MIGYRASPNRSTTDPRSIPNAAASHPVEKTKASTNNMVEYERNSEESKARDGDGLLALAESSRKRCQRLDLLKGERLRIWPYLHLRLQRDLWTISKECRLTDCTSVRSLACRICLWHFLGSGSCGILRILREGYVSGI